MCWSTGQHQQSDSRCQQRVLCRRICLSSKTSTLFYSSRRLQRCTSTIPASTPSLSTPTSRRAWSRSPCPTWSTRPTPQSLPFLILATKPPVRWGTIHSPSPWRPSRRGSRRSWRTCRGGSAASAWRRTATRWRWSGTGWPSSWGWSRVGSGTDRTRSARTRRFHTRTPGMRYPLSTPTGEHQVSSKITHKPVVVKTLYLFLFFQVGDETKIKETKKEKTKKNK